MAIEKSSRVESIDILRGVVMVIMALDHVRDYFHYGSFFINPTDLSVTTPAIFYTRFITHYCAPVFVFLSGTSAFLYGSNKTKPALFKFLLTRGIWLIFMEIAVNTLIWTFDLQYSFIILQVIWAIGWSMIALSFLVYLPKKAIAVVGLVLVAGHNLLDRITVDGTDAKSIVWCMLHQRKRIQVDADHLIGIGYPVIPWIGLMALGYCFGQLYRRDFDPIIRKKWLLGLGLSAVGLFFVVRGINAYGDLVPWTTQKNLAFSIMSFFNVTKYPPSLAYLLATIGPALLFLYFIERVKNRVTDFFLVYGRVPFFYYFLHVLVIHVFAMLLLVVTGGNWRDMILTADAFKEARLIEYGYSLVVVYLVWIGVVGLLYPFCRKYMMYKANNKDKWWLSYL